MKFFKDLFTGKDNLTYDIGRVLWFQSIQAFIALSAYQLYKGGSFDPVTWGAGLAALLGAGGAALGLKSKTEPDRDGDGIPDYVQDYMDQVNAAKRNANQYAAGGGPIRGGRRGRRPADEMPEGGADYSARPDNVDEPPGG